MVAEVLVVALVAPVGPEVWAARMALGLVLAVLAVLGLVLAVLGLVLAVLGLAPVGSPWGLLVPAVTPNALARPAWKMRASMTGDTRMGSGIMSLDIICAS